MHCTRPVASVRAALLRCTGPMKSGLAKDAHLKQGYQCWSAHVPAPSFVPDHRQISMYLILRGRREQVVFVGDKGIGSMRCDMNLGDMPRIIDSMSKYCSAVVKRTYHANYGGGAEVSDSSACL